MKDFNSLINNGLHRVGDSCCIDSEIKTLVVVGAARGGTSLLSGVLSNLGVHSGDESTPPVFEDTRLARALEGLGSDSLESVVNDYNYRYPIWSFKRPSILNQLELIHSVLRNPVYLIVFRDIFSIANRNSISMRQGILPGLEGAYQAYGKIIEFISKFSPNAILISYEKFILEPEFFVENLVDLIGRNTVSELQIENAVRFVEPNPGVYLNQSRVTRSVGRIGKVERCKIIGWGKYVTSSEPAVVELYINDKKVDTTVANDFRQHLKETGVHPTGNCGYIFDLSENPLEDGDVVSVKLEHDVLYLDNSGNKHSF